MRSVSKEPQKTLERGTDKPCHEIDKKHKKTRF